MQSAGLQRALGFGLVAGTVAKEDQITSEQGSGYTYLKRCCFQASCIKLIYIHTQADEICSENSAMGMRMFVLKDAFLQPLL